MYVAGKSAKTMRILPAIRSRNLEFILICQCVERLRQLHYLCHVAGIPAAYAMLHVLVCPEPLSLSLICGVWVAAWAVAIAKGAQCTMSGRAFVRAQEAGGRVGSTQTGAQAGGGACERRLTVRVGGYARATAR